MVFEEYLRCGREIKVVYHNSFDVSKTEVAYGELTSIDDGFLCLTDLFTHDNRYVAIKEVIAVSLRRNNARANMSIGAGIAQSSRSLGKGGG